MKMIRNAICLAAGRGARMGKATKTVPKAPLQVPGGALIEILIENLLSAGVEKIAIVCGYLGTLVADFVKNYASCEIVYQTAPPGTTVDGLMAVAADISSDVIMVQPDHYFPKSPFPALVAGHRVGEITLLVQRPREFANFGYGIECWYDPVTRQIDLVSADNSRREKMVIVDGVMILPAGIFPMLGQWRGLQMYGILRDVDAQKTFVIRGALVDSWWANINTMQTLDAVSERILGEKQNSSENSE